MKSTPFAKATGPELEENRRALRAMRGLGLALLLAVFCFGLYCGLFMAWRVFGW